MTTLNNLNIPYLAVLCFILILAGVAEYLHLAPTGSFYTFLLLVIGLVAPSPLVHTTTVATAPIPVAESQRKG